MKKAIVMLLLLFLLPALTACQNGSVLPAQSLSTNVPGTSPVMPEALEADMRTDSRVSALFFRFGDEPFLASEYRVIQHTATQSYETALIQALLSGPAANSPLLQGLFPENTRVLATSTTGRTLFVTLSEEIMNQYPDEPVDWQEYDFWRLESPLRRELCMEALVATVTENCDVDQVQVLVEQKNRSSGSLRLKQNFFLDDAEDDVLVEPMSRTDAHLLTADGSMLRILKKWQQHDWASLYRTLESKDPQTGLEIPSYQDFVTRMEALPDLISFEISSASVSLDGLTATYGLSASVRLSDGSMAELSSCILRLYRVQGLWSISLSQLTGWLEVFT